MEFRPDSAEVYYIFGDAYLTKGDYDLAIARYDRALQLKPDYAEAHINRGSDYLS